MSSSLTLIMIGILLMILAVYIPSVHWSVYGFKSLLTLGCFVCIISGMSNDNQTSKEDIIRQKNLNSTFVNAMALKADMSEEDVICLYSKCKQNDMDIVETLMFFEPDYTISEALTFLDSYNLHYPNKYKDASYRN